MGLESAIDKIISVSSSVDSEQDSNKKKSDVYRTPTYHYPPRNLLLWYKPTLSYTTTKTSVRSTCSTLDSRWFAFFSCFHKSGSLRQFSFMNISYYCKQHFFTTMLYSVFEFYRRMKIATIVKVQNCCGTSAHVVSSCRTDTYVALRPLLRMLSTCFVSLKRSLF